MSTLPTVARMVRRYGTAYTLRKPGRAAGANSWTAGAEVPTYHACKARARELRNSDGQIKPGLNEGESLVTIDAQSISVDPTKGDLIALGTFTSDAGAEWLTVVDVYGPREAGRVAVYKLRVKR